MLLFWPLSHLPIRSWLFITPQAAAQRWQDIITADAANVPAQGIDWSANVSYPYTYTGPVDDIIIFYQITPIDGPFNILGQAGPLYYRIASGQPISAFMEFDYCTFEDIFCARI